MRIKKLGLLAVSAVASIAALAPASASAATSVGCENGAFSITLPGGRTLAPGQDAKVAASALPAGSRLHVQGRYVQFDVDVNDFSIYDWALTGAPNSQDLTGGRFTPIFASKVADLKGARLTRELEVKPYDSAGSGVLLQRTGGAKMKVQAKDCATGGVFQVEGETGTGPVTFTHTLAPGVFYFLSPFTGKTQIGNGDKLIAKDSAMACVVMASIIVLSIVLGAELGPKADPTTTTYTPRPEWYFFFLFELLRVIKPPALVPLATIGIPTICMILLFLLPFYDRGPERRPERRPIATLAGLFVIAAMGYLTYLGASAGPPTQIDMPTPARITAQGGQTLANYEKGKLVVGQSGCLACHKIGENGNDGPGPELTDIASRLPAQAIARTLINPTAPMPSFAGLQRSSPDKFNALVTFLGQLRGGGGTE